MGRTADDGKVTGHQVTFDTLPLGGHEKGTAGSGERGRRGAVSRRRAANRCGEGDIHGAVQFGFRRVWGSGCADGARYSGNVSAWGFEGCYVGIALFLVFWRWFVCFWR